MVVACAAMYYWLYIDATFNIADDGSYAQVVYELRHGIDPHRLQLSYGIAWFKLGQFLFWLTGNSYLTAEALFHGALAIVAGLVFVVVGRLTRNPWLALAGGALTAAAPAFPATAFYAVSTMLNLFCQMALACRWRTLRAWDVVPAAVALAVTFQIRPDFGYFFAIPLGALLLLSGGIQGGRIFGQLLGAALAAFISAHIPLAVDGLRHGYFDLVIANYLRYPALLWYLLETALNSPAVADNGGAGAVLARTPLSALWHGPLSAAKSALTLYAPVAGIGLFVACHAAWAVGSWRRGQGAVAFDRLIIAGVLLASALASFPHYFLFRPDLAHVANFMAGYTVLALVLVGDVARKAGQAHGLLARGARAVVLLVVLTGLAGYGWVGLTEQGSGSITVAQGRTQRFIAANGVDVRLTENEHALYSWLYAQITENSRNDDPIICVPFCPGIAFMTGRRMLLGDFYVDDALLLREPDWIDRAIAASRASAVPVVVVQDWAINGTNQSRFVVWARRYIDFLDAAGYRRVTLSDYTVYIRP